MYGVFYNGTYLGDVDKKPLKMQRQRAPNIFGGHWLMMAISSLGLFPSPTGTHDAFLLADLSWIVGGALVLDPRAPV